MWAFAADAVDGPYAPIESRFRLSGGGAAHDAAFQFGALAAFARGPGGARAISQYMTPAASGRADVWVLPMRAPVLDGAGDAGAQPALAPVAEGAPGQEAMSRRSGTRGGARARARR